MDGVHSRPQCPQKSRPARNGRRALGWGLVARRRFNNLACSITVPGPMYGGHFTVIQSASGFDFGSSGLTATTRPPLTVKNLPFPLLNCLTWPRYASRLRMDWIVEIFHPFSVARFIHRAPRPCRRGSYPVRRRSCKSSGRLNCSSSASTKAPSFVRSKPEGARLCVHLPSWASRRRAPRTLAEMSRMHSALPCCVMLAVSQPASLVEVEFATRGDDSHAGLTEEGPVTACLQRIQPRK